MSSLEVDLPALPRFLDSLEAVGAELVDLEQVNAAAGGAVVGFALPNVPIRTGALRDTVHAEPSPAGFALVAGSAAVDYAGSVHARTPFFTDALAAHADDVADRYLEHAAGALAHLTGS